MPFKDNFIKFGLVCFISFFSLLFTSLLRGAETGEQSEHFGDYVVYYSAFNSSLLTPEVARQYKISRAGNRGLVNIAIRKGEGKSSKAAAAKVSGSVKNLLSQTNNLDFRKIEETDAIYYIASFRFDNQDMLKFSIHVETDTGKHSHSFDFKNKFYID